MLRVIEQEHLDAVREFAKTQPPGAQEELERCINRYADDDTKEVVLMKERMAPHSFYFEIYHIKEDGSKKLWYNGGIIYHASSEKKWGIHT